MSLVLPGILGLSADNPGTLTGAGNWTYLLTGRRPTLIDAGVGTSTHLSALAVALDGRPLEQVIVTHAHSDHASGITAIRATWPSVICLKFPWPELDGRYEVPWQSVADGNALTAGDGTLEVLHTPGHAPDHVVLWDAARAIVFGGDLLVQDGSVVVPGSRGGDLKAYLASLARVEALSPKIVLPAHGPAIDTPVALIRRYVEHRMERERQVVAALAAGAETVAAITDRVYPDLTADLRTAAEETVHAHVTKLRDEARVDWRDGRLVLIR
jgi:glyoxylase-like metal-dependent hydrolase (beta-lactamase superfamily II)